jgi:hypothetical protein
METTYLGASTASIAQHRSYFTMKEMISAGGRSDGAFNRGALGGTPDAGECGCADDGGGSCSPCGDGSPPPPVHVVHIADAGTSLFLWRPASPLLFRSAAAHGTNIQALGDCAMNADVCIDDDACTPPNE